jgi:hypothetical protein
MATISTDCKLVLFRMREKMICELDTATMPHVAASGTRTKVAGMIP